jgi:hypothetical protein
MQGFDIFNCYNLREIAAQQRYLERVGLERVRRLFSSGLGLSRYLRHHEDSDVIFISAFLTGTNKDDEGYGYGGYSDGEVDSLGLSHSDGDRVSHSENRRRNSGLSKDLRNLGYSFFKVHGVYDGSREETFGVLNFVEDYDSFLRDLVMLGRKYSQHSILVVPRGSRNILPFLYFLRDGRLKYAESNDIHVLDHFASEYSQLNGKKYSLQFNFSSAGVDLDGLSPIRSGMERLGVAGARQCFRGYRYRVDNAIRCWPLVNH